MLHDPRASVVHEQGASVKKVKALARVEYHRSRNIFFEKHRGFLSCVFLRCGILVRLLLSFLFAWLGVVLTLGRGKRLREKAAVYTAVMGFYFRGCPLKSGIRGQAE